MRRKYTYNVNNQETRASIHSSSVPMCTVDLCCVMYLFSFYLFIYEKYFRLSKNGCRRHICFLLIFPCLYVVPKMQQLLKKDELFCLNVEMFSFLG